MNLFRRLAVYFIATRTYGNFLIYALKKYFLAVVNFTQAKDGLYVHNFNFAFFFSEISTNFAMY